MSNAMPGSCRIKPVINVAVALLCAFAAHRWGSVWGHIPLKDRNIRSLSSAALLMGLVTFVVSFATKVDAQEFQIEEANSVAELAVDQLKPKAIAFIDRPNDELIDPDVGLIRFEDWTQARPVQKQFLSPYPSYLEPN